MMRAVFLAGFGMALAAPALSLTPPPLCNGGPFDGKWDVWNADDATNGYVMYRAEDRDSDKALVVLEHCKTGKSVISKARFDVDQTSPDYIDNVTDAVDDYVSSKTSFTLKQIANGLKGRGISTRLRTLSDETCGCSVFYPNDRGNRAAYE